MEYWDAYDGEFRRMEGVSLVRGEDIPAGVYHLVCDVLVRHTDGSYLLTRRDPRKHYGGLWEATAGGSALRGETPLDCARRELREGSSAVTPGNPPWRRDWKRRAVSAPCWRRCRFWSGH